MKKIKALILAFSLSALFSTPGFAEETGSQENTEDLKDLNKMEIEDLLDLEVTTVSKYSQKLSDAPATVVVITADQIKARGYQDLKEIFYDLPGFDVSSNVAGEVRSLVMPRGLTGDNKVLVLQDGQRMNSPTGERFLFGNNIPIIHAKRIEVIYGPASAIYGADAFGAIVNIITSSGSEVDGIVLNPNYGNLNTFSPSVTLGKKFGDFDMFLFGRMFSSDGQKFLPAEYKELEVLNKYSKYGFNYAQPIFNFDIYGKLKYQDFSLLFDFNSAKEPNGESEIPNQYLYTRENVWGQRLGRMVAQYDASFLENKLESITTFSNFIYEVTTDTNFYLAQKQDAEQVPTEAKSEFKYAYSATQKIEEQLNFRPVEYLNLIGGVSFENLLSFPKTQNLKNGRFDPTNLIDDMSAFIDPQNGKAFGFINEKAFGVRPYQNYAGYLQAELIPLNNLRFTLGGRYDYNTLYQGTFNPRVGAVYKPIEPLSLKLHYGTAYLQPSNYYRWENWANPFAMHVPNLDLSPEKVGTVNFSANYQVSNNFNIGLDLFRNDVTDIIKPVPIDQNTVFNPFLIVEKAKSYAETNKNFGKQYTQGAELKFNYSFGNNQLFGVDFSGLAFLYYSFLNGEDLANTPQDKNTEIAKVSNHKVSLGTDLNIWKLTISPRLRWVSPISTLPFNSEYKGEKFPGYLLVNLNTRLNIINNLSAYFTVNNLLDTPYYAAAPFGESVWILPRAPQAKRTMLLGLEYTFGGSGGIL